MRLPICILLSLHTFYAIAQAPIDYKTPPKIIADLVLAKDNPTVMPDQNGRWTVILNKIKYTSLKEISTPHIKLAGLSVNTLNHCSFSPLFDSVYIKDITTGKDYIVKGLPRPVRIGGISWSPLQTKIAFTQINPEGVDIYVISIASMRATKVNKRPVNAIIGNCYDWLSEESIIYKSVSTSKIGRSGGNQNDIRPLVTDTRLKEDATSVNKTSFENDITYYLKSQLILAENGLEKPIVNPNLYESIEVSPDKRAILCHILKFPSKDNIVINSFDKVDNIYSLNGILLRSFTEASSAGRGRIQWRNDAPSTVVWFLSNNKTSDLYSISFPFTIEPHKILSIDYPFALITWGNDSLAYLAEENRNERKMRMQVFNPHTGHTVNLFEGFDKDNVIESPLLKRNQYGRNVLNIIDNQGSFLIKNTQGGLSQANGYTGTINVLWMPETESNFLVDIYGSKTIKLLIHTADNFFMRHLNKDSKPQPVISFDTSKYCLNGVSKKTIRYLRKDSIILSGILYLPPNYNVSQNGPLPLIIWSYPKRYMFADEYTPELESNGVGSVHITSWEDPQIWLSLNYAVFIAGMPVLPRFKGENANDHLIDDLVMNAEAAVSTLVKMGVADKNKIAIAGHSYGGFMTANLLAHTNLFKTGIAMSGIYNTTFFPFGFQGEKRDYWSDPNLYLTVGPLFHANKIKAPILFIHGDKDDVTPAYQTENIFSAVKGNGGTARFVILPFEGHGYRAEENVLHLLWEEWQWLEHYLKDGN